MRTPIFVRPLTDSEQHALTTGLRSPDAFTLRRCQILLASARHERAPQIAAQVGCDDQTVRNAVHAFNRSGLDALLEGSSRPHRIAVAFDSVAAERLRALLHQSPRAFGKPTSLWTLDLAAAVCVAEGITDERVTGETIRVTLKRLGVRWQRAKHWITSPDPAYARKKRRDRLIRSAMTHPDWALGFADEVWWSRVARPHAASWGDAGRPLRLVEQTVTRTDPDPKALACYGLLVRAWDAAGRRNERMLLRFVAGRPISGVTTQFLDWCSERLAAQGKRALLLVWDNASWHISKAVRGWIRAHNRAVKRGEAGVRIIVCPLPSKSPWLNPIEPKWMHGKRRIAEPARLLTADEIAERVCACFDCLHEPHLHSEEVS